MPMTMDSVFISSCNEFQYEKQKRMQRRKTVNKDKILQVGLILIVV